MADAVALQDFWRHKVGAADFLRTFCPTATTSRSFRYHADKTIRNQRLRTARDIAQELGDDAVLQYLENAPLLPGLDAP